MTRNFVNKLEEGQQISSPFLIKSKQLMPFKNKEGKFLHLVIGDKTGDIEGRLWEGGEEIFNRLANVATIEGEVVRFRDTLQINIANISPCSNFSPADFLPESARSQAEMISELRSYIATLRNDQLKNFLECFFADDQLFHKYIWAPAAKYHHQAYLGGLLEHTLGVVAVCRSLAKLYPNVDVDLLTTGAIIHDIGKVEELAFTEIIQYTDQGRLIGHIVIGAQMVDKALAKIAGFPEELRCKLIHMIVSHHGQYEWQSPKKPKFLEALLLHHADLLDAQIDKFLQAEEKAQVGSTWSPWIKELERYVYLK